MANLRGGVKYNSADVQIKTHADGITGHQNIITGIFFIEQSRLCRSRFRGQGAVNNRTFVLRFALDFTSVARKEKNIVNDKVISFKNVHVSQLEVHGRTKINIFRT